MQKLNLKSPWKVVLFLFGGLLVLSLIIWISPTFFARTGTLEESSQGGFGSAGVAEESSLSKDAALTDSNSVISPAPDTDQKVIKNASVSMKVEDLDTSVTSIKAIVDGKKGFIQNLSDTGTYNNRAIYITLRVPATDFNTVLEAVKALASEVTSVSENSDDITEQYQDLEARLKTQRALEQQMIALLNKATKIADILTIQRELTSVRQQIELYETQKKYYDSQADMSTISLTLVKAEESQEITSEGWRFMGVVRSAFNGLVGFGKVILTVIIYAVIFSPIVWVPWIIVIIVRKLKKKAKK